MKHDSAFRDPLSFKIYPEVGRLNRPCWYGMQW